MNILAVLMLATIIAALGGGWTVFRTVRFVDNQHSLDVFHAFMEQEIGDYLDAAETQLSRAFTFGIPVASA